MKKVFTFDLYDIELSKKGILEKIPMDLRTKKIKTDQINECLEFCKIMKIFPSAIGLNNLKIKKDNNK